MNVPRARLELMVTLLVGCSASAPPDLNLDGSRGEGPGRRDAAWRPELPARSDAGGELGTEAGKGDASLEDLDGDGIADALELAAARQYLPHLSLSPSDGCPLHGILFRLTRHPQDPKLYMIWYVVLYLRDCGLLGHEGDDEVFGALVDPGLPAPAGLLALRAIAHQGSPCQHVTTCGSLPGCAPCTTTLIDGELAAVVFSSQNKHGNYVSEQECDNSMLCDIGGCTLNPQPDVAPLVNAGEPGQPLTTDLTQQGFITPANGWNLPSLLNFNPWGGDKFGGAGKVSEDLVDSAFVVSPAGC